MRSRKRLRAKFLLMMMFLSFACQSENKSIDVCSYQVDSKTKKHEILKKYLTKDSGLIDFEYHIWYQDNSDGFISAPSDYNMKLALRIDTDSLNSWIDYLEPLDQKITLKKWEKLKLDRKIWKLNSEPELYHSRSNNEVKLLFREEGVILAIYSTNRILMNEKEDNKG